MVLSPLLETTTPWRILRFAGLARRGRPSCGAAGALAERRGCFSRRLVAPAAALRGLAGARLGALAGRSSVERCGPGGPGRARARLLAPLLRAKAARPALRPAAAGGLGGGLLGRALRCGLGRRPPRPEPPRRRPPRRPAPRRPPRRPASALGSGLVGSRRCLLVLLLLPAISLVYLLSSRSTSIPRSCATVSARQRAPARLAQAGGVLELAGRVPKAQVEQLLAELPHLLDELLVVHVPDFLVFMAGYWSSRITNLVLTGSLWPARRIASRASGSGTPASSNITRPGLHDGDPALGRALAGAHAGLGRLLRHGLVREDVDPDLAATLDLAGHRDSCGLDLAVGDPAGVERLQPVLAELHGRAALRQAGHAARCCLRCLTRFGISMRLAASSALPPRPPPRPLAAAARRTIRAGAAARSARRRSPSSCSAVR